MASHTQTVCTESDDVTAKLSYFKNPDLMAITFSHLRRSEDGYSKYLFYAALTCKDFLEEALDELWVEIHSLNPLLKLFPALQLKDGAYVLNGDVSQADWDRLHYFSRRVKSIDITYTDDHAIHPSTYKQILQLHPSALFPFLRHLHCDLNEICSPQIFLFQSPVLESLVLYNIGSLENGFVGQFLAVSSSAQLLSRIALRKGQMSVDILKRSIVHIKHLRYLELSVTVFMSDFSLWKVLGTLPFLENLTLEAADPGSHQAFPPSKSNKHRGGPRYFRALRSLWVTGPFFLIKQLLDFIDSPRLMSIKIYPIIINAFNRDDHGPDDLFTPSMTIVAKKWSQSLKTLHINSTFSHIESTERLYAIPKSLMLLKDFPEMYTFFLEGWKMENTDDDVRDLVTSWPKLTRLVLPRDGPATISLSTLRIIAERCPDLRHMHILLDTSSIPPFDTSSKSLGHKLESLLVGGSFTQTSLECQIRMARCLDLIFPYMELTCESDDATWSGICEMIKLCQDVRRVQ